MGKNRENIIQGIEEKFLKMPYGKMLWLRLEFMMLCDDEIEALIMRVVEYEIEGTRQYWLRKAQDCVNQGKTTPEEPEHWWIPLSYKQFMIRLYGVVKNKKTVIEKLNKLTGKQFLLRRDDPENKYGTPQYTINKDLVQEKLNGLPDLPSLKDAAKSVGTQPKKPIPVDGTPPPEDNESDPSQVVVPPIPVDGTPHTSSYHSPIPVDGTGGYQQRVPVNNSNKNKENKDETDNVIATARADVNAPTQSFSQTSLLGVPEQVETKTKKEKVPAKEKKTTDRKTAAVSEEELALRKQVHAWVDKRRGYSLQGRATAGAVIQENRSCTTLASLLYRGIHQNDLEGCTWDDLNREWDYIAKNDKYWKLSENKDRIGAQTLLQMFAQTMPKIRQPNTSNKNGVTPSAAMTHNEACNVAQGAIAKGKQHGYVIDAKVYSSNGGWLVNVVWDGQTLFPIESRVDVGRAIHRES